MGEVHSPFQKLEKKRSYRFVGQDGSRCANRKRGKYGCAWVYRWTAIFRGGGRLGPLLELEKRHKHGAVMVMVWRCGLSHILELERKLRIGLVMGAERRFGLDFIKD